MAEVQEIEVGSSWYKKGYRWRVRVGDGLTFHFVQNEIAARALAAMINDRVRT